MRRIDDGEPLRRVDLVRTQPGADLIVQDLGRRSRQAPEARLDKALQERLQEQPEKAPPNLAAFGTFWTFTSAVWTSAFER